MNIVEPILFQAKINPNSIAICTPGGTYSTAFRNDVSVVRLGINFRP
jgi:hypothetical protein